MTKAQYDKLKRISAESKQRHAKRLISLRIDQESIDIAKSFGKGYTNLFAKLIYIGIRDPEILRKAVDKNG